MRFKINLAKSAGFCFGVKRALDIAYKAVKSNKKIYMLGDIVHNEEVVKKIKKLGIKKVAKLLAGKNKTLLIRAHGIAEKTLLQAKKLGYKIIDATCPMVKEIHKIVKSKEKYGYKIIVIGDKNHDEVKGIIGQLKTKAIIIEDINHIPIEKIRKLNKIAIVVQSTQKLEKVKGILEILRKHITNLNFFDTICNPTKIKQNEIKTLPLNNDLMLIIGSKNSANTKRLFEISKSLNKDSYWITRLKDIDLSWFKNIKTIGITAGASTPQESIEEVIDYLKNI